MKSTLRCIALAALSFVAVAGCATEPELNDDYVTYEVSSEPIPLTPIPGADIGAWTEAIEGLDVGEWSSAGVLISDDYVPARAEPVEDPRVEGDRLSWEMEEPLPHEDADITFAAHAVTDAGEGVLSIYCEAVYDTYEDPESGLETLPFEEVRRVLQGCMAGSGNDAIGSEALATWIGDLIDAAEAEYEVTEHGQRFGLADFIGVANVLVWFGGDDRRTTVSLSVDPRAGTERP